MANLSGEIERLTAELAQEKATRDSLEQLTNEIEVSTNELENQLLDDSDDADNEWKLRYEEQFKINAELRNQLAFMNEKIKELTKLDENESESKQSKLNDTDLRNMLKLLEREKRQLEGNLKDLEWKLDSESQDLFRLNEGKKKYKLELNQAAMAVDEARLQAKTPATIVSPIPGIKFSTRKSEHSLRNRHYGIPDNHRILDPRKGPVKRTAAVKTLPKLLSSYKESKEKENQKPKNRKIKSSEELSKNAPEVIETNGFDTS